MQAIIFWEIKIENHQLREMLKAVLDELLAHKLSAFTEFRGGPGAVRRVLRPGPGETEALYGHVPEEGAHCPAHGRR